MVKITSRAKIVLTEVIESAVRLKERIFSHIIDLIVEKKCTEDHSKPEVEIEPTLEKSHNKGKTNIRVLEYLHNLPSVPEKTVLRTQENARDSVKYISRDNTEFK